MLLMLPDSESQSGNRFDIAKSIFQGNVLIRRKLKRR
jgi:hypothetical protein